MPSPFETLDLGRMTWSAAWEVQTTTHASVAAGGPSCLLFVEHPPTISLGRSTRPEHLPVPEATLRAHGFDVVRASRGGSVTYHGPGQLVGYPILCLRRLNLGPRQYLEALEEALADALKEFGAPTYVRPGLTGVWTDDGKIAAIGVQIRRGVTLHGFCLNVAPDLTAYNSIVPCGLQGEKVTSMAAMGIAAPIDDVKEPLARSLADVLTSISPAMSHHHPAGPRPPRHPPRP